MAALYKGRTRLVHLCPATAVQREEVATRVEEKGVAIARVFLNLWQTYNFNYFVDFFFV